MRIAVYNDTKIQGDSIKAVIERVAIDESINSVEVVEYDNVIDLESDLSFADKALTDLVIMPDHMPGDLSGIQIVVKAIDTLPLLQSIILSDTGATAPQAAQSYINEYLVDPVRAETFEAAVRRRMRDIAFMHDHSFMMVTHEKICLLPYYAITHCETSGHDQNVYMIDGTVLTGYYSSQELYDELSCDGRFFKLGSSYIVNKNEVTLLDIHEGTVTLTNAVQLPVPSRIRKEFETFLLQN